MCEALEYVLNSANDLLPLLAKIATGSGIQAPSLSTRRVVLVDRPDDCRVDVAGERGGTPNDGFTSGMGSTRTSNQ
jgi:hypothetical protein